MHGLFAAIDYVTLLFLRAGRLTPIFKVFKIAIGYRFTGFNFNRHNIFSIHQQAIDLFAMTILPKVRQVILTAMEASLDELVKDQVLEECAFHVMQIDLALVADAQQ